MSAPTTSLLLNKTTPAAPSGDQNVTFQSDGGTPLQQISGYPTRMVGDSGSGGMAGTVPPPAAGDGAAKKWLKATGAWLAIVAADLVGAVFGASGGSHSVGAVPDPGSSAGTTRFLREDATWAAPAGGVTSVGLTVPAEFSVSGSPVTGSGTLAVSKANQSANLSYMGPASGSPAAPTFRAIDPADLPLATTGAFGAVKPDGTTVTIAGGVISAVTGTTSPVATSTFYPSASRATGTVYQNTSSYPLIVLYVDLSSGSTAVTGLTDSSNPPTTEAWKQVSFGSGNGNPCMFVVKPGDYYKITGTSAGGWYEWLFNTGTISGGSDLSGSRVLNTNIQNTGSGFRIVEVVMTSTSGQTLTVVCDSTSTPSQTVSIMTAGGTANSVFMLVPASYYYKVTASGGTVLRWREYDFSIAATQSANLFTAINSVAPRAVTAPSTTAVLPSLNTTQKLKFLSVVFNDGSTGSSYLRSDDNVPPRILQWFQANTGGNVRTVLGFQPPGYACTVNQDSGGISASTAWMEYTLG